MLIKKAEDCDMRLQYHWFISDWEISNVLINNHQKDILYFQDYEKDYLSIYCSSNLLLVMLCGRDNHIIY